MLLSTLYQVKEKEAYQGQLGKITDALKKAAGEIADLKMEDLFNNLADPSIYFKIFKINKIFKLPTTSLWLVAIILLSISLFCISLYFDKIYLGDHLTITKNFYNNSFECLDTFKEKIICIEKKSVLTFPKNMEVYSYISSRISMIISVLIPLIFCIKNFNTNKRNQIAYKHIATVFRVSDAAQQKFSSEKEFSKAEHLFLEKYAAFLFQSPEKNSSHDDEDKESYKQAIEAGQLIAKVKGKD